MSAIESLSERKQEILHILAENTGVSVAEISRRLSVSAVTVRNDLQSLEETGYLVRTRGGALPAFNHGILERQRERSEQKNRIARAAAAMVRDGDTVMIEAGTTTALVGKFLLGKRDVHVVTNSTLLLPFARYNPSIHMTITGGAFRPFTESFVGPIALRQLEQFHVRIAFVGTDGFSNETGLTTHLVEGAEIVRKMADRAEQTVLVADSSKYGRAGFAQVIPMERVHHLVCDSELEAEAVSRVEEAGVVVQLV